MTVLSNSVQNIMMPEEQNMTDKQQIYSSDVLRVGYRDGAGNTT